MRRFRSTALGAALLALALIGAACGEDGSGGGGGDGGEDRGTLTVGGVAFAENQIAAEMYAQVLEDAGYTVERQTGLESREVLQPAIEAGDIDIAPEYLSSLLLFLDPDATASGDPDEARSTLEPLLEERGQTLLESAEANDTNAFVVTAETAEEHGLASVSDLAPVAGQLTLGGPPECPERPFCIPGLRDVYGVEFGQFVPLDVGGPLTVEALDAGEIDVALLFSTSSVIEQNGWVVLEDDENLQNAENITPVVRSEVLDDTIEERLNAISAALDTETMTELNGRVEVDEEDPADVAADFLEENGLLGGASGSGEVTVGAVAFAENQIMGELYAQTLEDAGFTVDRQLTLESREILNPAMENGEIDIAPEYLASLLLFLDPEAEATGDPENNRSLLEPLLEERGQTLLESAEANDTNALVVTQETADQYSLSATSDLAKPAG